jgi:HEAT repeat protein
VRVRRAPPSRPESRGPRTKAYLGRELRRRIKSPASREAALREISQSRMRGAAGIAARYTKDRNQFVRSAALDVLKKSGGKAYSALAIDRLRDRAPGVRVCAIECLVEWRAGESIPDISSHISDRSPLVRAYAYWALGRLGARSLIGRLRERRALEKHGGAKAGLLEALVALGADDGAFEELTTLLKHDDYRVRCFAAESLLGVARGSRRRPVVTSLRDGLARERTVAAREVFTRSLLALGVRPGAVPRPGSSGAGSRA